VGIQKAGFTQLLQNPQTIEFPGGVELSSYLSASALSIVCVVTSFTILNANHFVRLCKKTRVFSTELGYLSCNQKAYQDEYVLGNFVQAWGCLVTKKGDTLVTCIQVVSHM